jgi:hypothetical protein
MHCPKQHMHAMTIATKGKIQSYVKRPLEDNFIPLAIKTYGCFHSHLNSFFTFGV